MATVTKTKHTCLGKTSNVRETVLNLQGLGFEITEGSVKAGHLVIKDGDNNEVYRAIQKSPNAWLITYKSTEHTQWKFDETSA